jgi:thiol-disulfide isomerase/thioredoxin
MNTLKVIVKIGIVSLFFCFVVFLPFPNTASAQRAEHPATIYFFYGKGCPHCAEEAVFLEKLQSEFPALTVRDFEIWYNAKNAALAGDIAQAMGVRSGGVPLTFVGERVINGYFNDQTSGADIRRAVEYYAVLGDPDPVGALIAAKQTMTPSDTEASKKAAPQTLDVPIFGRLELQKTSLAALTGAIALVDGFNPCAMWVLLFLISMLLGVKNRRRQWIIGLVFIFISAAVYFLFMAAWLNIFLFVGFLFWIRLLIGAVAIASGIYQLREFFTNREGTCNVANETKRQKISARIKMIVQEQSLLLALAGVVGLAVAVNMVELVCSAGLPAIYTSVLSAASLPGWQYYGYLIFYVILYMLDDLVIFVIAMLTLQLVGVAKKYVRAANLVGGIIIFILGILLIFKPGWIML